MTKSQSKRDRYIKIHGQRQKQIERKRRGQSQVEYVNNKKKKEGSNFDIKTERQKDRKTERQKNRETERQRDRETERQKDRKTERQKDRKDKNINIDKD